MEEGTGISLYILVGIIIFSLFTGVAVTFGDGINVYSNKLIGCVEAYMSEDGGECESESNDELPSEGGSRNYTDIEEFMNIAGLDPYTAYIIAEEDLSAKHSGGEIGLQAIVGTGEGDQTYTSGDMDSADFKVYFVTDVNKLPTGPEYQHEEGLNDSGEVIFKTAHIWPEGASRPTVEYIYTTEEFSRSVLGFLPEELPKYVGPDDILQH